MNQPNWQNKTIWTGDNLDIMRGMNSESIDLCYLDPPFNSNANYAAPIGSKAAGAEFKDIWTLDDIDNAWLDLIEAKHPRLKRVIQATMTDSDKSYLIYMAIRLLEIHRLLKPTASIYLHCDQTMSHYLKLVMDSIWGRKIPPVTKKHPFKNEIAWCYKENEAATNWFPRKHDSILFYTKTENYTFNIVRSGISEAQRKRYNIIIDGERWANMKGKLRKLNPKGAKLRDWWEIPIVQKKEDHGYETQKPIKLLQNIILASSNEDDIVFDPFCGCATTCVTADSLNRQWVGIDIGKKAAELVRYRINDLTREIIHRTDIPQRTDLGKIPNYKSHRQTLYGLQGGNCNGCSNHFQIQNLTVDHIIARSKGGTDHLNNLQLLCGNCNSIKGNRGMEYLITKLRKWET